MTGYTTMASMTTVLAWVDNLKSPLKHSDLYWARYAPLVYLRLFKTLARSNTFKTESLLTSIDSTNAQTKVTDPCPTKMDTDIMTSSVELLAVGYPVINLQEHEPPYHWSQLDLLSLRRDLFLISHFCWTGISYS
jgi:hypothetical protein